MLNTTHTSSWSPKVPTITQTVSSTAGAASKPSQRHWLRQASGRKREGFFLARLLWRLRYLSEGRTTYPCRGGGGRQPKTHCKSAVGPPAPFFLARARVREKPATSFIPDIRSFTHAVRADRKPAGRQSTSAEVRPGRKRGVARTTASDTPRSPWWRTRLVGTSMDLFGATMEQNLLPHSDRSKATGNIMRCLSGPLSIAHCFGAVGAFPAKRSGRVTGVALVSHPAWRIDQATSAANNAMCASTLPSHSTPSDAQAATWATDQGKGAARPSEALLPM